MVSSATWPYRTRYTEAQLLISVVDTTADPLSAAGGFVDC
jgi:hypothetical protein